MGLLYDAAVKGNTLEIAGVFVISNTMTICIYEIDHADNRVLASAGGDVPEWYAITEQYNNDTHNWEPGFMFGSFFVPFSEVVRM